MSLSDIDERPPTLTAITHQNEHDVGYTTQDCRNNDISVQHEHLDVDTSSVVGEKDLIGQVVEGTDGEYYLVAPNDDNDGDVDIDEISHVKIMVGSDGSRLYVVDNNKDQQHQQQSDQQQPAQHLVQEQSVQNQQAQTSSSASGSNQQIQPQTVEPDQQKEASFQPGTKGRRNRVYGSCKCHECGQTFVNTARLERHLAVHQIFGSFVCPLCSKTYKYEYNLFYHWRKTCRDLDEVFTQAERKDLDVNTLRSAVDELVKKKRDYHQIPLARKYFNRVPRLDKLAVPITSIARRNIPCRACGVAITVSHMNNHLNLHRGIGSVGDVDGGCFYCDLCGLMFKQYANLTKHWRVSCPEIQANIPNAEELDEHSLKNVVSEMMKTVVCDPSQLTVMVNPTQAILREKARFYDSTTGDLDFDGNHGGEDYEYDDSEQYVFTDDILDEDIQIVQRDISSMDRNKWLNNGMPVQCNECKRAFANVGRLERHMAGYHSSYGSHHCPLCGNRFKYDYNLLYHYRRSCPYTKSFIETDMRQQLDAQTLRKLVRSLAQKDLRVMNNELNQQNPQKEEYGDMSVRREMLGREAIKNLAQIPPNKPGIPDGKNCPLCGITFYGLPVLNRHVRAAHPRDSYLVDPDTGKLKAGATIDDQASKDRLMEGEHYEDELDPTIDGDLEGDDMPPELEKVDDSIQHDEGPLHLCDAQGRIISQVQDLSEFQALVDSGQLDLRPSDRFMLMDSNQIVHSELIYEDSRFVRDPHQIYYQQQYEEMEEELEKPMIDHQGHHVLPEGVQSHELDDIGEGMDQHEYDMPPDISGPSTMGIQHNEPQEELVIEEEEVQMSPRRSARKRHQVETPQEFIVPKMEIMKSTSPKRTRRNTKNDADDASNSVIKRNLRSSPQKSEHLSPRRSLRHK